MESDIWRQSEKQFCLPDEGNILFALLPVILSSIGASNTIKTDTNNSVIPHIFLSCVLSGSHEARVVENAVFKA